MDGNQTRLFEWIGVLESSDSGRLMLTNLLFGFRANRPDREILRRLFAAVVKEWCPDGGRRADGVIENVADQLLEHAMCSAPTVRLARCSRVVDALSLVLHNIDHARLGFGVTDEVPPSLLQLLEDGIPANAAINMVKGRRPLAWVTSTECLDALRASHDDRELATAVRDRLGLKQYDEDQLLVQIDYPPRVTECLDIAAPTFLEGGAGVIFRARFCGDSLGRTVDLASLDDGVPEAVHRPIDFTADFRIRRIGRPRSAPGFEFVALLALAEHPWTGMPDDLAAFLATCGGDCE